MSLWWDDSVTVTVLRACPNVIDTIIVASHLNQSYSATWVYGTLIEKIRQISGVGLRTLCSLILFLGFAAVIGMKFYETMKKNEDWCCLRRDLDIYTTS
ncbi:hypothetical protein L3X38_042818 [Prunus dulcis]|uniref:Uncharacterized protein n=1 Tax=Prunus dulcis TaxID=3755 RepID=A0AAD4YKN6_PRUDU|nr:hypothetical protein L3X38_042818 [Prunus dulcis]